MCSKAVFWKIKVFTFTKYEPSKYLGDKQLKLNWNQCYQTECTHLDFAVNSLGVSYRPEHPGTVGLAGDWIRLLDAGFRSEPPAPDGQRSTS